MSADFYTVGRQVVVDVCNAITQAGLDSPGRRGQVPGQIAWDSCGSGQCGQLALSTARMYLANQFPAQEAARLGISVQGGCGAPYLCADYSLQLIRCVPGPDENGTPPSAEALDAAAKMLSDDAEIVVPNVACSLQGMVNAYVIMDYAIVQAPIVGPQGGCAGVQVDFSVARAR